MSRLKNEDLKRRYIGEYLLGFYPSGFLLKMEPYGGRNASLKLKARARAVHCCSIVRSGGDA